jgi:hypothetical protein
LGILFDTIAFDVRIFTLVSNRTEHALQIVIAIGWVMMTLGFGLVLYSRLHLITDHPNRLRLTLWFIVISYLSIHVLTLVAAYNLIGANAYRVMSRLGILFYIEETILSSLYIYLFFRFMRQTTSDARMTSMFYLLIMAQVFLIICDAALITLGYVGMDLAKLIVIPFTYTLKLKVEFVVLNRLVRFARKGIELQDVSVSTVADSTDPILRAVTSRGETQQGVSEDPGKGSSSFGSHSSPRCDSDKKYDEEESLADTERRYLGRFGAGNIV